MRIFSLDVTGNAELSTSHDDLIQWHIETKYYSAQVSIDIKRHSDLATIDNPLKYPAVILLSDGDDNEVVDQCWKRFDQHCDIRLLVTSESEINPETKPEIQDWCLRNEFELIGLNECHNVDALDGIGGCFDCGRY